MMCKYLTILKLTSSHIICGTISIGLKDNEKVINIRILINSQDSMNVIFNTQMFIS